MSNALNMENSIFREGLHFMFMVKYARVLLHVSSLNAHVDVHNFAELYSNLLESVDKIKSPTRYTHNTCAEKTLYYTEYYTYTK